MNGGDPVPQKQRQSEESGTRWLLRTTLVEERGEVIQGTGNRHTAVQVQQSLGQQIRGLEMRMAITASPTARSLHPCLAQSPFASRGKGWPRGTMLSIAEADPEGADSRTKSVGGSDPHSWTASPASKGDLGGTSFCPLPEGSPWYRTGG